MEQVRTWSESISSVNRYACPDVNKLLKKEIIDLHFKLAKSQSSITLNMMNGIT